MNIFLHEFKVYLKTTIIWVCSIIAVIMLFMLAFPSISKDAEAFKKMLESYPGPIRQAFGSAIENIGSVLGFYSFIFVFIVLCGAIQAMNLGASILSKEMRDRTADFLLTKPVSRVRIMTSKLLAAVLLLFLTSAACYASALIAATIVKTGSFDTKAFFMINASLFFIQLIFMALGIIISVLVRKLKSVLPVSLSSVFAFFFIGMFLATDKKDIARYFSPFKYFDTDYIIKNTGYEAPYLITAFVIIVTAVAASYIVYARKDIHTV